MKKLPHINRKTLLTVAAFLIATVLFVFLFIQIATDKDPLTSIDPTAPNATQDTQSELRLPDLLGTAKAIKSNLTSALQDMKLGNWESARNKLDAARAGITAVRSFVDNMPLLINLIPQAKSICELLDAADMAIPEILMPAIDLLEAYPLSALSVGDGFDTMLLCKYLDFAESVMPKLEQLLAAANSIDLSLLDSEGKIADALQTANKLMAGYHENPAIFSMLKAMLGAEGDRLYLIAVQNSSEIRASGGFPGSIGTLHIEDGILSLGDFIPVNKVLSYWLPKDITITKEEYALFSYLSGIQTPWDADLCPNFERVGHIWAASYEARHKKLVSGVISVTPHIVQRLLAAMDGEIELSDGLVLNGDNATEVLIHDIYFKYFDRRHLHPERLTITDQLFAEAAQKTMKKLTVGISADQLLAYLPVMKESIADRTLMLWMKDAAEQSFVVSMGWSGGLNTDPQKPEAGVYFNVVTPCKMGWFLLMDTEIGQRAKNPDGSFSYPVTVTFSNNITEEERKAVDSYISGGLGGAIRGVAYFFAPAGGSVDSFTASNGKAILLKTYNGMTLGFMDQFLVKPDDRITVTYTVTTAPGVDTPLEISKTPTAQQF